MVIYKTIELKSSILSGFWPRPWFEYEILDVYTGVYSRRLLTADIANSLADVSGVQRPRSEGNRVR